MSAAVVGLADGAPGPTLVLPGDSLPLQRRDRVALVNAMVQVKRSIKTSTPILKHAFVFERDTGELEIEFIQGLIDGGYDLDVRVCVNTAAVAVASTTGWHSPTNDITVSMGGELFTFTGLRP